MVIAVALAQGLSRSVEISADQALLANVVPASDLANAISLTTMAQQGSRAVGPLLAGPLLATVGVEGAYGIAAVFSLLALASVMQVRTSSHGGVVSLGTVRESLREGFRYVAANRPVLAVFALVVAHCSLTMSFDAMLPGFAETDLHEASGGFTLMTLGVGIGALVGVFVLALTTHTRRGTLFLAMGLASGLAPVMMGWSMDLRWAVFSAVLMGSSQAMFMALASTLLQEEIADAVRGRVMSLYLMSAGGIMAVANLAFGTLADRWGAPVLFWAPGALFVAIVVLTGLVVSDLRKTYRTGRMALAVAPA
jgi:MFS family permease